MNLARLQHTPCPQCGAPVAVPQDVATFRCAWCGATLQAGEGVPLHFLVESPRLDREGARQHAAAWLSGPGFPADLAAHGTMEVGEPAGAVFLRVRRREEDTVRSLLPVQLPEVMGLSRVPGDLRPPGDDVDLSSLVEPQVLKDALVAELAQPGVHDLVLERRAYYPVCYSYRGDRYTAAVPAAGGQVLAVRLPARREVLGERGIAAGVVAVLFAEAVFVPGLALKLAAVAATGAALYPTLNWLVRRYG